MNFEIVADESVDFRVVTALRIAGLTVYSIGEEIPSITDISVLSLAVEKRALLITEDKDFGELVFRLKLPHHGILLIRISENHHKLSSVVECIKNHYEELISKFSVINDQKLRIKEY